MKSKQSLIATAATLSLAVGSLIASTTAQAREWINVPVKMQLEYSNSSNPKHKRVGKKLEGEFQIADDRAFPALELNGTNYELISEVSFNRKSYLLPSTLCGRTQYTADHAVYNSSKCSHSVNLVLPLDQLVRMINQAKTLDMPEQVSALLDRYMQNIDRLADKHVAEKDGPVIILRASNCNDDTRKMSIQLHDDETPESIHVVFKFF